MAISYTQTADLIADFDNEVGCTGAIAADTNDAQVASDGGTPSTVNVPKSIGASVTGVVVRFGITPAAGTEWAAGTWTTRLNVVVGNMNLTITAIYICHLSSTWTNIATIGSATGLSIALTTTGVKSQDITGSAITPSAGDTVGIFYVIANGAMSVQSFEFDPDQIFTSPFNAPVVAAGKKPFAALLAHRRFHFVPGP